MNLSELNISITRKSFLRYIRIKINDDSSISVVAPRLVSNAHINKVLLQKNKWISKTFEKMKIQRELAGSIASNETFYLGEKYTIEFKEGLNKNIVRHFEKKVIYLDLTLKGKFKDILEKWFTDEAKNFIPKRVAELNKNLNYKYEKVFVRKQSTRWGTCSSKKNLSFNIKLIKSPIEVLDYVIYHELSHLKEFSHSKKFWALVEASCPDYKEAKVWLKNNRFKLQ